MCSTRTHKESTQTERLLQRVREEARRVADPKPEKQRGVRHTPRGTGAWSKPRGKQ